VCELCPLRGLPCCIQGEAGPVEALGGAGAGPLAHVQVLRVARSRAGRRRVTFIRRGVRGGAVPTGAYREPLESAAVKALPSERSGVAILSPRS
jgi:hypothetical protein